MRDGHSVDNRSIMRHRSKQGQGWGKSCIDIDESAKVLSIKGTEVKYD